MGGPYPWRQGQSLSGVSGVAQWSPVGDAGKRRAGRRCPLSTSTSDRGRNSLQPRGLALLSDAHSLKRGSSPPNPIPDPLLQGDWAAWWGPVSRAGARRVSQDTVGVPARSPAQEAAVSICMAKRLCLFYPPQVTFLTFVPALAAQQGHHVGQDHADAAWVAGKAAGPKKRSQEQHLLWGSSRTQMQQHSSISAGRESLSPVCS